MLPLHCYIQFYARLQCTAWLACYINPFQSRPHPASSGAVYADKIYYVGLGQALARGARKQVEPLGERTTCLRVRSTWSQHIDITDWTTLYYASVGMVRANVKKNEQVKGVASGCERSLGEWEYEWYEIRRRERGKGKWEKVPGDSDSDKLILLYWCAGIPRPLSLRMTSWSIPLIGLGPHFSFTYNTNDDDDSIYSLCIEKGSAWAICQWVD